MTRSGIGGIRSPLRLLGSVSAFAGMCALAACGASFQVRDYPTPISLYRAGVAEFEKGNWNSAITALDQVTILLPPRDTLITRAHMLLGRAYMNRKSYILAAATFKRLFEDFPDDTLADDALLAMAEAHEQSWRGPEYDAKGALAALDAYSLVGRLFPASPLLKKAADGEERMTEGLAQKDVLTGDFYMRRKAWNSALISFRDVTALYPETKAAKQARLLMITVYRNLKFQADIEDACKALRADYAKDPAVVKACAGIAADTAK